MPFTVPWPLPRVPVIWPKLEEVVAAVGQAKLRRIAQLDGVDASLQTRVRGRW